MRTLLAAVLLAAATPAVAGEPVLVPDFTPGATSEFALAFLLQGRVIDALSGAGHVVITSDAARPVVGDATDACADVPSCPTEALQKLPARVAVVVRIVRKDEVVQAHVALYEKSGSSPIDTRDVVVKVGQEQALADLVVAAVNDLFADIGPGPADDLVKAAQLVAAAQRPAKGTGGTSSGTTSSGTQTSSGTTSSGTTTKAPSGTSDEGEDGATAAATSKKPATLQDRLEGSDLKPRHFTGSKGAYLKTDELPGKWTMENAPHAGRVTVEVRAGMGFGDVDRAADVRVDVDPDLNPKSTWFQEGPTPQNRPRAGLFLGYSPTTWFDFGAVVGLQYGHRTVTTQTTVDGVAQGEPATATAQAAQLYLDPLARFYIVPLGPAKPYLLVGGDLRVFDTYDIVDPANVDYPNPPGGVVPGVMGGGGMLIDPGPIVGFFAEGTYAHYFGVRAGPAKDGDTPADPPSPPQPSRRAIGVVGGVQFRL